MQSMRVGRRDPRSSFGTLIRRLARRRGAPGTAGIPSASTPKRPTAPSSMTIDHEGRTFQVGLKRVATARRFTLRVRAAHGDIVLTMPPQASRQAAQAFALRHAGWMAERLSRLSTRVALVPGTIVPFRGEPHRVVACPGLRRRAWVAEASAGSEPDLCVSGPASLAAEILLDFLREEARRALGEAVARHAGRVGKSVRSLTLRDTKTRWGSCTAGGALNFSWRLIFAPPFVLDYLAAHEVAHLVHMNHSAAFWQVTRDLAPRMDEAEAWLKTNGPGLHRYGS